MLTNRCNNDTHTRVLACLSSPALSPPLSLLFFKQTKTKTKKKKKSFLLFICSYSLSVARGSVSLSSGKQSQAVCCLLLTAHTLGVSPTQYIIENGCCGPFGTLLFFLHQQRRHCQEAALGGFAFFFFFSFVSFFPSISFRSLL